MKTPDFIKNFEIVKKEKIKNKTKILENIISFSIKFIEENSQIPLVIIINENIYLYLKEIFFEYRQLTIPFIDKEFKKIYIPPFLNIETDKGIFQISFISKGKYDYLKIKTPENNIILLYLWIKRVPSNEMFLIYDSLETPINERYQETDQFIIDFFAGLDLLYKEYSDLFDDNDNLTYEDYTFNDALSFFENIVFSVDNFLLRNYEMPNVIVISEEKYELIESLYNKRLLQREIIEIHLGMMSEVEITLDNEDIIQILVERKNKEILYVVIDDWMKLNEFSLVYDESFPGKDNNDDDNDDDDLITTPPVFSPEFCEVVF